MSIHDSRPFDWEEEDKAMAERLDAEPTPDQIKIMEELEREEWFERGHQIEKDATNALKLDLYTALDAYFAAGGLGFTRTTLADLAWDVHEQLAEDQATRDPAEDAYLDAYWEDLWEV